MPIKHISAAQLCKKSARQILYLQYRPQVNIVTPEQYAGIKYQKTATKSKYQEMCGTYHVKDTNVYFSWDEVQVTSGGKLMFIEHKQVSSDYEKWYLHNSMLQTALYAALTVNTPVFKTAKFYQKLGNKEYELFRQGYSSQFYLKFGKTTYKCKLINSAKLLNFIKKKVQALVSWDDATSFDAKWKHKEYEQLKEYFKFNKVE